MFRNFIKIIWGLILISFAVSAMYIAAVLPLQDKRAFPVYCFLACGMFAAGYLLLRYSSLIAGLTGYFRNILAGKYDIGIKTGNNPYDEITRLILLANKAAGELNIYDVLRADRTRLSYRAMDMIYQNINESLILANMEKGLFQLNPSAQRILGAGQENFTFDSLKGKKENAGFMELFEAVAFNEKIVKTGKVRFQLITKESAKELDMKLLPLKDGDESVKMVFIFIKEGGRS